MPNHEDDPAPHQLQTRAAIYLWHDPLISALCRMDAAQQRQRCEAYAAMRGWTVAQVLIDEPSAQADKARPALAQLHAAVREHAYEVVLTPALACLGPAVAAILAMAELLAHSGIELVCLHESFDTTSAHGSYALLLLRALARIAEQTAPVQLALLLPAPIAPAHIVEQPAPLRSDPLPAAPATRAPRQRALPFGYQQTADGVAIDPAAAAQVRRIFRLYEAGATVAELMQLLREQGAGRWSQRALLAVLANEPAYRGGPRPDGGTWPALLEPR